MSGNDGGWRNTLIYTSLAGNITLVDNIYSYGEIRYDKDEKEIVYAQIKPYIDVGIYNFYKLKNARFVHSKSVGYEDRGKYVVVTGSSKKSITEQQSQAYFKKLYYFSFKNLSNA